MSGRSFKFDWQRGVLQDDRLSPSMRMILCWCALVNSKGYEGTFRVRQETVAERLHVHPDTVSAAFRRARKLGWLEVAEERQRGRGWHQADLIAMTFPSEIPCPTTGYSSAEYPVPDQEIPGRPSLNTLSPIAKYPVASTLLPAQTHPDGVKRRGIGDGVYSAGFTHDDNDSQIIDAELITEEPQRIKNLLADLFKIPGDQS
jgi:hypothetical protein